jgi:DNA-3-methyladenine glycosylase
MGRLDRSFFMQDALEIAPHLLGCALVRRFPDDRVETYILSELEVYRGEEDRACHAFRGRTKRTGIMYQEGGRLYMYLIYGMYWMMNIVTALPDQPQAILIRGVQGINGPGRITRSLRVNGDFYGEDLVTSGRIWIERRDGPVSYQTTPRINIDYAGDDWIMKPWRFILAEPT